MAHWNPYDEAVLIEKQTLRTTTDVLARRRRHVPMADSYRAQALRELAHRLLLEEALAEVQAKLAQAVDRFEAAECALDIARWEKAQEGGA